MSWCHLTMTLVSPRVELTTPENARWLWPRMQALEPLAMCLMPSHPHLIVTHHPDVIRRFGSLMGAFARHRVTERCVWLPASITPISGLQHLQRTVRYLFLNPCRAGLVRDPLLWPWSTYRDVVGAIALPVIDPASVAQALGQPLDAGFIERLHRYVSSDPQVRVTGTPPPTLPTEVELATLATHPLVDLAAAAAAALRTQPRDLQRRSPTRALFLSLAHHEGWNQHADLARTVGVTPDRLRDATRRGVPAAWLSAARLCLHDDRLRQHDVPQLRPRATTPFPHEAVCLR